MTTLKLLTTNGMLVGLFSLVISMGLNTHATPKEKGAKPSPSKKTHTDSKQYAKFFPKVPDVMIMGYEASSQDKAAESNTTGVRSLSSAEPSQALQYQDIKQRLLNLKTDSQNTLESRKKATDELNAIILELDTKYDSIQSPELKLLAAILIPLRTIRGITWNMGKIFDGHKMQQGLFYSMLRSSYQSALTAEANLLTIVQDYLNLPYKGIVDFHPSVVPHRNEHETPAEESIHPMIRFQGFIGTQFYPALNTMKNRILMIDTRKPISIDLAFFRQIKGFPTVTAMGNKEKLLFLAGIDLALGKLAIMLAYDASKFPDFVDNELSIIARKIMNPISNAKGLLPKEINDNAQKYQLYTMTDYGKDWLKLAFIHYSMAYRTGNSSADSYFTTYHDLIDQGNTAIGVDIKSILKDTNKDLANALNPGDSTTETLIVKAQKGGISTLDISNVNLTTTTAKILNKSNGRVIEMNLGLLFTNPPVATDLFPTSYSKEDYHIKVERNKVFNPQSGLPSSWEMSSFRPYFPNATERDLPFIKGTMMALGFPFASHIQ